NYTNIADKFDKPADKLRVIFARRLFDYRGTRVFTNAIKRILDEGYDINVTVAGSGPDENWMHEQLDSYISVSFIKYQSHESLDIHKDKHIAVVPTIGSEGTSLSLLEAMSAQCAVVCTNVGGMTNIVLDGHNGLIVNSGSVDQLYEAIKRLLDDEALRIKLSNNAYQSVIDSFSYEKWAEQWKKLLTEIIC
ncbi:MAG: glycosyltransferase family 4 protein, partial [Clostridia bacterium]|nr:glycosyltransferase family 4 protein [Clostridia bacterium]